MSDVATIISKKVGSSINQELITFVRSSSDRAAVMNFLACEAYRDHDQPLLEREYPIASHLPLQVNTYTGGV